MNTLNVEVIVYPQIYGNFKQFPEVCIFSELPIDYESMSGTAQGNR